MAGHKWTSEENITALLLVPYVTRQKLKEIFEILHSDEKRRYFFYDRTEEAINSHITRRIKSLKIDEGNDNLSPAMTASELEMEWGKKKLELPLASFINSILSEIELKFPDLNWTEISKGVTDIKKCLEESGQAGGEHSS